MAWKLYSRERRRTRSILYNDVMKNHPKDFMYFIAPYISITLFLILIFITYNITVSKQLSYHPSNTEYSDVFVRRSRSVSSNITNNTGVTEADRGLAWEQCDFEKDTGSSWFWVVFYLWWIFYLFIGLAVICDDFFVPALEVICEKMELSEDVAGATFMAAGSSAPELFTSIVGVWQETDVGVGTIVGSAIFNILIIISLSGVLAGQVLYLDWRPLLRDISFYGLSIGMFMGVAWDGKVYWWEALLLLSLYILYILLMVINPRLMKLLAKCTCWPKPPSVDNIDEDIAYTTDEERAIEARRQSPSRPSRRDSGFSDDKGSAGSKRSAPVTDTAEDRQPNKVVLPPLQNGATNEAEPLVARVTYKPTIPCPGSRHHKHLFSSLLGYEALVDLDDEHTDHHQETRLDSSDKACNKLDAIDPVAGNSEDEDEGIKICCCDCCIKVKSRPPDEPNLPTCKTMSMYRIKWIFYVLAFPYYLLFTFTVPDCSKEKFKRFFMATFIISVIWILALSFAMVTLVSRTGCILNINEFTMGLVIIAIGTSVPDCLSSIMVARDGFGDMAVSNAIGSNVFDIDMGLGLPFLLSILVRAINTKSVQPIYLISEENRILMTSVIPILPHVKFAIILLVLLCFIFGLFVVSKFKMNMFISASFVVLYGVFLAYAFVQEIYCAGYRC